MLLSIIKQPSESWFRFVLRYLLGGLFIFSAVTKLFPVEYFELTFVSSGLGNWNTAPWMARGIIALEFALGVMLLFNSGLRRVVFPLVNMVLLLFIAYLILISFLPRPEENCGCFGSLLPMTPMQAVIKNIVLVALGLWLRRNIKREEEQRSLWWMQLLWFPVSLFTLLLLVPVTYAEKIEPAVTTLKGTEEIAIAQELITDSAKSQLGNIPSLLGIFNPECSHCVIMAKKIALVERETELPPMHVLFVGDAGEVEPFLRETGLHCTHNEISLKQFMVQQGLVFPSVLLVDSGRVIQRWSYASFDPQTFAQTFKE